MYTKTTSCNGVNDDEQEFTTFQTQTQIEIRTNAMHKLCFSRRHRMCNRLHFFFAAVDWHYFDSLYRFIRRKKQIKPKANSKCVWFSPCAETSFPFPIFFCTKNSHMNRNTFRRTDILQHDFVEFAEIFILH